MRVTRRSRSSLDVQSRRCVPMSEILRESLGLDRKSTRLNSSHSQISYAVFCLKKKKKTHAVTDAGDARDSQPASADKGDVPARPAIPELHRLPVFPALRHRLTHELHVLRPRRL